ncbi:unnamed protein product [Cuscuta europaea]|uniref:Uncharacterized protein n=1 Tax=Cuscuta europaea TaxID=41803 RepID=A0A9P0ZJL5_CUSEU|nr:unnamed protein product [Cuscuta europaea]
MICCLASLESLFFELSEQFQNFPCSCNFCGVNMDVGKLFALKKKGKTQAQKKDPSVQPPVGAFFQKEAPEPSAAEGVVGVAEGATKKKKGSKAIEPPSKKQRGTGGTVGQDAPLVIIEDRPSPDPPVDAAAMAQTNPPLRSPPREILQLSLAPGASVLHGSAEPKAFLRGMTSVMDKAALSTYDDEALENRILRSSLTACVALGEHAQRLEQWRLRKAEQDREMKELILKNSEAVKQMAMLEEDLRKAAEGKAAAEEARLEAERAAKKAAEEAEIAKAEAVAKAREEAVVAFVAEGWKTEDRRQWVASVVESSVDDWVKGPGADWMAEKGDSYYQGGEFFTQHLVYRRLARHFKVPLEEFDPSAYGLPALQPDVRNPLPPGEERPVIHDSMMMGGSGDDDIEDAVGEEVTSKPAEEAAA